MKIMTTLGTAVAFASLSMIGSDALAQSASANKAASGQSATHATPGAPHADPDAPGVGGTQGANSGTNTSAGPEGANIRPTNQGAAEAGMADSTMDKDMKSDSKSKTGQGAAGGTSSGAQSSGAKTSSGNSGSGATSASGATGASGNSARAGEGMDDPARTADRSGVTGAPDEMEREQRDLERDGQ